MVDFVGCGGGCDGHLGRIDRDVARGGSETGFVSRKWQRSGIFLCGGWGVAFGIFFQLD